MLIILKTRNLIDSTVKVAMSFFDLNPQNMLRSTIQLFGLQTLSLYKAHNIIKIFMSVLEYAF